jgi:hypothetical protein
MNRPVTRVDAVQVQIDPKLLDRHGAIVGARIRIARPGIYEYTDPKTGRTWRELVPREVLKDPDLIASINGAPMAVEHPPEKHILPDSNKRTVGSAYEGAWSDDEDAQVGRARIHDREGLNAIANGQCYLSPSYGTWVEEVAGTDPEFGDYDTRQLKRTPYNSIILTANPRGGETLQLSTRADAMSSKIKLRETADSAGTQQTPPATPPAAPAAPRNDSADVLAAIADLKGVMMQVVNALKPAENNDGTMGKNPEEKADTRTPQELADELVEIKEKADAMGVELKGKGNAARKLELVKAAGLVVSDDAGEPVIDALYAQLSAEPVEHADSNKRRGVSRWRKGIKPAERTDSTKKPSGLPSASEVRAAAQKLNAT